MESDARGAELTAEMNDLVKAMKRRIEILEAENEALRFLMARHQYEIAMRIKFDEESA